MFLEHDEQTNPLGIAGSGTHGAEGLFLELVHRESAELIHGGLVDTGQVHLLD